MSVKCTHYKLCSVQSKLVYFSQFWGMKHFLGPVCDIWPIRKVLLNLFQFIVTTWVCIFGKCLLSCLFINTEIFGREICYELLKPTNSLWHNFLYQFWPISTKEFDFHISYEKRLKLGEQRKIPGVNITKVCTNLSAHWKFPYMLAEEHLFTTCILSRLHMWEFMWQETKKMKHRTKHKTFGHFYESRTWRKSMRL